MGGTARLVLGLMLASLAVAALMLAAAVAAPAVASADGLTANAPDAPAAPTLTSGNASLGVSWSAVTTTPPVNDYDVQYREKGTETWTALDDSTPSTATTASITGLTNGKTYEVQVRAGNSNGDSPWSPSAELTAGLPGAPGAVSVTPGDGAITVTWTAADGNGSTIDNYDVQYRTVGTSTWTGFDTPSGSAFGIQTPFNDTSSTTDPIDMGAITHSYFTNAGLTLTRESVGTGGNAKQGVYKFSKALTSIYFSLQTRHPDEATVKMRYAATKPTASNLATHGSEWCSDTTAPSGAYHTATCAGEGPIAQNGYLWAYTTDSETVAYTRWVSRNIDLGAYTGLSATVPVTNGTTYEFQVRASSPAGQGGWSPSSPSVTAGVPAAPAAPALVSGNATMTVSWSAPDNGGSAITDYDVRHSTDGSTWTELADNTNSIATTATISTLTNGTSYQVQVRAGNTHGDGPWSPSATLKAGLPAAPAAPRLDPGNAAMTVGWSAPDNGGSAITDYDVRYSTDGSTWTELADNTNSTATIATISTLTNGTSYQVQVRAGNTHGDGPWSPSATLKAGLPATPTAPKVTVGTTSRSLTVMWTVPANNGSPLTSMEVRHKLSSASSWTQTTITDSSAMSATLSNLTNGVSYDVQVAGTNAHGTGPWSPSTVATPGVPDAPAAPSLVSGNATMTVSWSAPDNGGSAINDYDVRHSTDGSTWTELADNTNSTSTSATISTLTNGTSYQVQVRAGNANGDGPWSPSATLKAGLPAKPGTPTLAAANTKLTVTWTAPSGNGSDVTGFKVRYKRSSDTTWSTHTFSSTGSTTSTTITGLTNATAYDVQVAATNTHGDGPWSDSAAGTPTTTAPGKASTPTAIRSGNTVLVYGLVADTGGSTLTDWDVRWSSDSGTTWTEEADTTNTSTIRTLNFTDLIGGLSYVFSVRAENANGTGEWSDASSPAVAIPAREPAAPVPALVSGDQRLTVSWDAPNNNGAAISDYDVQYSTDGSTWTEWNASDTSTTRSATITGLTNGTSYQVQVRATNTHGDSAWSASATLTAGLPAAPAAPVLGSASATSLSVSWSAPTATGGSAITDYDVRYCSSDCDTSTNWTELADNTNSTATTATISTLTAGTAYQVQVRAQNANGEGPWSASATLTAGTPATPAAPTLTPGNASITVSWTAPANNGANLTGFKVRHKQSSGSTWTETTVSGGSTTSTSLTTLTNGTSYDVQVAATNSRGDSAWSPIATATPQPPRPGAPAAPTLSAANASIAVSWSAPANIGGSAITDYDVQYSTDGSTWTNWYNSLGTYSPGALTTSETSNSTTGDPIDIGTVSITGVTVTNETISGKTGFYKLGAAVDALRVKLAGVAPNSAGGSPVEARYASTAPTASNLRTHGTRIWQVTPTVDGNDRPFSGDGWTGPLPANTYFWIVAQLNTSLTSRTPVISAEPLSTGRTATITGLTNGTAYQVQVRAENNSGDGPWSASATATPGLPATPTGVSLTSGPTALATAWTAPANNGSAIYHYEVRYRTVGTNTWTTATGTAKKYQPSVIAQEQVDGPSGNAYDMGTIADGTLDVNVDNESIGSHAGVYELEGGVARLRVKLDASTQSNSAHTVFARVAASKPTATNLTTHGTQLWSDSQPTGGPTAFSGDAWTGPLPSGSYFWVATSALGAVQVGRPVIETDPAVSAPPRSVTGLTAGTSYEVQVRAHNANGAGPWSASATGKAGAPAKPTTPTAAPASATSLTVTWTAVTGATGYTVGRCSASCDQDTSWTTATVTGGNTTTHTFTGLTAGTSYQVRVRATNTHGSGAWSSASAGVKAGVPAAPAAPTLTVGHQKLAVSWTAPANNGSALTGFKVQYKLSTANTWTTHTFSSTGSTTSTTITGLQNSNAYDVQVAATNTHGDSAWSATASATPRTVAPDAPNAPTLSSGNRSLAVSWTAPNDNGSSITDYDVGYCTGTCSNTGDWTLVPVSSYTQQPTGNHNKQSDGTTGKGLDIGTVSITGLTVTKVTTGGISNVYKIGSAVGGMRIAARAQNATNGVTLTYQARYANTAPTTSNMNTHGTQLWTQTVGYGSVFNAGAWTPALPANAHFWITTTASGTSNSVGAVIETDKVLTATSHNLSGLTNGTTYRVRVRAANVIGESAWSASAQSVPGAPAAPAAPTITASGNGSLTATWTEPAANGSAITDYDVRYSSDNGANWTEFNASNTSTATTATVTGLTNNTSYVVSVRASNARGDGAWSPASAAAKPGLPAAPTAPSLVPGDQSLTATWAAANGNGNTVTAYAVQYCSTSCTTESNWSSTNVTVTLATRTAAITGLTNNTSYQVRVRAANTVGNGPWSPTATHKAGVPAAPGTPTLTAGNTRIDVAWTAPVYTGSSLTYAVQHSTDGATWLTTGVTVTNSSRTAAITGLTNGTEYRVRVRASNSVGDGPWSAEARATSATVAPATPTGVSLTSGPTSLAAAWTAPDDGGAGIYHYDVRYRTVGTNTWTTATGTATKKYEPSNVSTDTAQGSTGNALDMGDIADGTLDVNVDNESIGSHAGVYKLEGGVARLRVKLSAITNSSGAYTVFARTAASKPTASNLATHGTQLWSQSQTGLQAMNREAWTGPLPASSYFWISASGTNAVTVQGPSPTIETDPAVSSSPRSVSGLTAGTSYEVQVRARNANGAGPWSASVTGKAGAPATPTTPTAAPASATSLTVTWTAVTGATGYTVGRCSAGCDQDSSWTTATVTGGNTTTHTFTGLTAGTSYQVRVRATNTHGSGAWSQSATQKAGVPAAPAAPTLAARHQSLAVSWTAPADNGSALTGFKVQYKLSTASTWTAHTFSSTGSTTSTTITGLNNGSAYDVQVAATNTHGDSAWSPTASATPATTAPATPAAPALTPGNGSLNVSWTAPNDNGSAITDYDIGYCTGACTNDTDWSAAPISTYSHSGVGRNGLTSDGSAGQALDLGTVTITNVTVTKVTTGGISNVYKIGSAVGRLRIALGAKNSKSGSNLTYVARYANTAPSTSNMNTHGTQLWTQTIGYGSSLSNASAWTPALPANAHFWVTTTASGTTDLVGPTIQADYPFTSTSHTVTGLTNGTTYKVRVRAANAGGDSTWSSITELKAGLPSAPAAPTITASGNGSLTATWTEPANNGSAITDYDVRYSSDNGANWTEFNASNTSTATTATVTGLTNNTSYVVSVRAANTHGDGPWSPASAAAKPGLPAAPAAPTLVPGSGSLTATWAEPANNGNAITDYDVRYKLTSASTWTETSDTSPSTTRSATLSPLTDNSEYEVQVRAGNTVGDGPWSASATHKAGVPAVTGTPTLTAGNTRIDVAWTAPAYTGSSLDYDVEHSTDGTTWATTGVAVTVSSRTAAITGLTNDTEYRVRVRASNSVGDGPWSAVAKATPQTQRPGAPAAPTLTSRNAQLLVNWTAPTSDGGSSITDYDVRYSSDSGANWTELADNTNSTVTSATISTLTNGTSYQVQVRAGNARGDGPWSASATLKAGLPAAPAPSLVPGSGSLAVSWAEPADNGNAITDYDVRYKLTSASTWTETSDTSPSTTRSATLSPLTDNSEYEVQVRAGNTVGDGPWSASATHKAGVPAVTGTPTLTAGNTRIDVAWTAPAYTGSSLDYDVEHSTDGSTWATTGVAVTVSSRTAAITGLTNDTEYQVRVRASNSVGDGPWSAVAKATPVVSVAVAPATPAAPVVTPGNGSLNVSWTAPNNNGSTITDYDVGHCAGTCANDTDWSTGPISTYSSNQGNSKQSDGATGKGLDLGTVTITNATVTKVTTGGISNVYKIGSAVGRLRIALSAKNATNTGTVTYEARYANTAPTTSNMTSHGTQLWTQSVGYGSSFNAGAWTPSLPADAHFWITTTVSAYSDIVRPTIQADYPFNSTSHTVSGLTNGTTYKVRVRAANAGGDSAWSSATQQAAGVPSAPAAPTITASGNGELTVTWTEPANSGSAITDYDVRYSSDSGANWTEFNASNTSTDTSATVTGLTNNTSYVVSVRAANTHGDGAWSPASAAAKPGLPVPAAAPTLVPGSGSLTATWVAVSGNGNTVTGYKVEYCSTSCSTETNWSDTNVTVTFATRTATITGLTNGTAYQVRVRATNIVGDGPWSATATHKAGVPAAPGTLTLTAGHTRLDVSWAAPAYTGSSLSYTVEHSTDGTTWVTTGVTVNVSARTAAITGLTNGTAYQVRVRATNSVGNGPWSETEMGSPGAPAAPAAPTLASGNAQLAVSWTAPADNGDTITAYDVEHSTDGTTWSSTGVTVTFSTRTAAITGLTNGTAYQVRVRATNSRGSGAWSPATTDKPGKPQKPSAPTVSGASRSLSVSWIAPTENGLSITDYDVQYKLSTDTGWSDHSFTGTTVATTITGLRGAATYNVRVRASSTAGAGPWSLASAGTATLAGKPDAPAAPALVSGSSNQITVTWAAPHNGGAALSGFKVEYKRSQDSTWTQHTFSSTGSTTSTTITGLTNSTTYNVRVRATNTHGDSAWSSSASAVAGAPSAPRSASVTSTSDGTGLMVSFGNPSDDAGSAVTGYDIRYRAVGTTAWTLHTPTSSTLPEWETIGSLTSTTEYELQARAKNAHGAGAWSDSGPNSDARRHPGAPVWPVRPHLAPAEGGIGVDWDEPSSVASPGITDYDVQYRELRLRDDFWSGPWTEWTFNGTNRSTVITGVHPEGRYLVQVRARNAIGWGEWSAASMIQPSMDDDKYACLREDTTLLRVGSGCHIYGGYLGEGRNHTFDSVEICREGSDETQCVALGSQPALLAKQNESHSRVRMIAYDGTGGTRVVRTKLGDVVRGVFTIKVIPFGIGEVEFLEGSAPHQPVAGTPPTLTINTTYILKVEIDSPYNRSFETVLPNCTPDTSADPPVLCWARTWVDLSFPDGSSMTGKANRDDYSSSPRGILGWRRAYLQFGIKTGATPGPGPITVTAYGVKPIPGGCSFDGDESQIFERCYTPPTPTKPVAYNVASGSMQMNVVATAGADPVPPEAVAATAAAGGDTSVAVSWTEPDSPAAPVEGYEVQYRRSGAAGWTDHDAALDENARSATITGLGGGTYEVRVRAESAFGWGNYTDPPATAAIVGTPPSAPTGLMAAAGNESVSLSWGDPSNPSIDGYEYQMRWAGVGWQPWIPISGSDASTTAHTVTGLDNGTEYRFKVRAANAAGTSKPAPLADPWFVAATPQPPPATPSSVSVTRDDGTVTASWPSVAGAASYHVTYSTNAGASWHLAALNHPAAPGTTSITIDGADNSATYIVGVRARNTSGDSGWRNSPAAGPYVLPPAAPTGLTATAGAGSVTLTWDDPSNPTITGYEYQIRWAGIAWGEWITIPDSDAATTSHTITGLQSGTEYRFKVRAVNAVGSSKPAPLADPWFVAAIPQ